MTQENGVIAVETYGEAPPEVVRDQVVRILSLDVDGAGFAAVAARDPVVGRLQVRYPGPRPVLFHSPPGVDALEDDTGEIAGRR